MFGGCFEPITPGDSSSSGARAHGVCRVERFRERARTSPPHIQGVSVVTGIRSSWKKARLKQFDMGLSDLGSKPEKTKGGMLEARVKKPLRRDLGVYAQMVTYLCRRQPSSLVSVQP